MIKSSIEMYLSIVPEKKEKKSFSFHQKELLLN